MKVLRAAVLLASVTLSTAAAGQDDEDPARRALERFRAGSQLFAGRDYAGARAAFEEAYRILPEPRVLANIATCFVGEGKNAEAVRTFRRFLHDGESLPRAALRQVEREIARLRPGLGDVLLAADPPGAEVLVDGTVVGVAPLPWPVAVAPGSHTLEVRAEGHAPMSRTVQLGAGEETSLSVVLQRIPDAPPPPSEPPPPPRVVPPPAEAPAPPPAPVAPPRAVPPTPLGRGPLLWTGVGLSVALAAGAVVTGLLALSALDEYEDRSTSLARRQDLFDETRTLADVTDVLLYAAIGAAIASAALFLLAGPDSGSNERRAELAREGRPWAGLSF